MYTCIECQESKPVIKGRFVVDMQTNKSLCPQCNDKDKNSIAKFLLKASPTVIKFP